MILRPGHCRLEVMGTPRVWQRSALGDTRFFEAEMQLQGYNQPGTMRGVGGWGRGEVC